MGKVLMTEEAAALMRVTTKTFYGWLRTGKVPAKKIGKEWRISEDALISHLSPAEPSHPMKE